MEKQKKNLMKKHVFFWLVLVLIISSCATIKPSTPKVSSDIITALPIAVSNINIPIELDLSPYFNIAEKMAPIQYEGAESPCEGLRYYYQFLRSPFKISGNKDEINLFFEGKYKIKGSYCAQCLKENCLLPSPSFSCGFDESLRRINIGYSSKIKILPNYHLYTSTTLLKAEAIDKCKIGFINYDITDKLIKEVRVQLDLIGKNVDAQIRSYDLKPYVLNIWNKLTEIQKVETYGYLSLNPLSLSVSNINMNGLKMNLILGLSCKPFFSLNQLKSRPIELPSLTNTLPQKGFNVYADLLLNYKDINELLANKLSGKVIEIKRKKIIIKTIHLTGIGNSKILLQLDFSGTKKGVVYLIGTPYLDTIKNTLSIPDLTFELKSKNVLIKTASWLLNERLTEKIKTAAVFDVNTLVTQNKSSIQQQLNRRINENIEMNGMVDRMSLSKIFTSTDALFLRVLFTGEVGLKIK